MVSRRQFIAIACSPIAACGGLESTTTIPEDESVILFHDEVGAIFGSGGKIDVARYEPTRGIHGTLVIHRTFELQRPGLLNTSGFIHMRHKRTVPPPNEEAACYANARIGIHSAATLAGLPALQTTPATRVLCGGNVSHPTKHKYAAPNLAYQTRLEPGWHRVEVWAGFGTDAYDEDGVGEVFDDGGILNRLNIVVFKL